MMRRALGSVSTEVWFRGKPARDRLLSPAELGGQDGRANPAAVMDWQPHVWACWAWASGEVRVPTCHACMSRPGASEPANNPVSPRHDISGAPQPPPLGATAVHSTYPYLRRVQVRAGCLLPEMTKSGKPTDGRQTGEIGAVVCSLHGTHNRWWYTKTQTYTHTTHSVAGVTLYRLNLTHTHPHPEHAQDYLDRA